MRFPQLSFLTLPTLASAPLHAHVSTDHGLVQNIHHALAGGMPLLLAGVLLTGLLWVWLRKH